MFWMAIQASSVSVRPKATFPPFSETARITRPFDATILSGPVLPASAARSKNARAFFSSPSIGSDRVVFGGRDKALHCARRSDGEPLWKFKTRRKVDSSPVICGDAVVFGSADGRLYIVSLADGEERWTFDIGQSVVSSPAVVDGRIYVGANDGRLYAFGEASDGKAQ